MRSVESVRSTFSPKYCLRAVPLDLRGFPVTFRGPLLLLSLVVGTGLVSVSQISPMTSPLLLVSGTLCPG